MMLRAQKLFQSKYPFYEYHMFVFISFLVGVFLGNYNVNYSEKVMTWITAVSAIATLFIATVTYRVSIESKLVAQKSLSFANLLAAKETILSVRNLKAYAQRLYLGRRRYKLGTSDDPCYVWELENLRLELIDNASFVGFLSISTDEKIKDIGNQILSLTNMYQTYHGKGSSLPEKANETAGNQYDSALSEFEIFCDDLERKIKNDCYKHR